MAFVKNFLLALFVCSTITLCLAKPKIAWIMNDDEAAPGARDVEMGAIQDNVRRTQRKPCILPGTRDCHYG